MSLIQNVTDALTALLMGEASKLEGLENSDMLKGVDMVEADNTTVYDNIPIPHGVKLLDLPFTCRRSYMVSISKVWDIISNQECGTSILKTEPKEMMTK